MSSLLALSETAVKQPHDLILEATASQLFASGGSESENHMRHAFVVLLHLGTVLRDSESKNQLAMTESWRKCTIYKDVRCMGTKKSKKGFYLLGYVLSGTPRRQTHLQHGKLVISSYHTLLLKSPLAQSHVPCCD